MVWRAVILRPARSPHLPRTYKSGIYTAPAVAPGGTDNGQVDVTAVATQLDSSTGMTTTTVTSNTAVVTVGAGTGLAITPPTTTVPAGGSHQFTATLNSVADPNATWTITSMNRGRHRKDRSNHRDLYCAFLPATWGYDHRNRTRAALWRLAQRRSFIPTLP